MQAVPWLRKVILAIGSLIVIWIGVGLLRSKASLEGGKDVKVPVGQLLSSAFVVTWLNPQAIIDDMLAGLSEEQRQSVLSIVDRREAIRTACMLAKPGDVILVAGKGHEDYQIVQGVKHHFDDHEVIREAFGLSDK